MEIEVTAEVKTYKGRDGKPDRRVQIAMVRYANGETRRWEMGLNPDQPPHVPGPHTLGPADFYHGKYGPEVSGWPKLAPVSARKAA